MPEIFDTLLLLALPASGKSEVRNYLTQRDPLAFHMGPTLQLDDFPYVHLGKRIDQELDKLGQARVFHVGDEGPYIDPVEWGTLVQLLSEDYHLLRTGAPPKPSSAARLLFERLDRARVAAGGVEKLNLLPSEVLDKVAAGIEAEARELLDEQYAAIPDDITGHTIVIELARGGPQGSGMPLPEHYGYGFSLAQFSPEVLERAAILYIWVDPEESRRKNRVRADPDDPGSILHHGTPEAVMLQEFGTCDMGWLIEQSDQPDTLRLESQGKVFHVPVARFDNREDKTSFLREDASEWAKEDIDRVHGSLKAASDRLWELYCAGR